MSQNLPKISEAELEIMKVVWENETPITSQEILEKLPKDITWKKSTVTTLISRLIDKGALDYTREGRAYYYTATIDEKLYKEEESKSFLSRLHRNSFKDLVVALYNSKGITKEDIAELRELFDKEE